VPAAIVFVAGITAGGEVLLLAMGVQIDALPALLAAVFATAFLLLAWVVSRLIHPAGGPADTVGFSSPPRTHDFLAVCAYCRKVRNEEGSWLSFEEYMLRHYSVRCSHGICPICLSKQITERKRR
jgi:hypothetical protein